MKATMRPYRIDFEEGLAWLVRGGRRRRSARVLGRETSGDGIERVWLDRLVIEEHEDIEDWRHEGAVSSILTRNMKEGEAKPA